MHVAWNQAIAQRVVLPEVLPALAEYVAKHGLSDAEIEEVTGLIANAASTEVGGARTVFCSIFRDFIFSRHAWVCELLPTGRHWRLLNLEHHRTLLRLPHSKDLAKPWTVMPALTQIPDAIYCDALASALVPRFDEWDEARLLTALQVNIDAALCDQSGVEYLTEFLRTSGRIFLNTQRVQEALVQLIQLGLRTRKIEGFRAVRSSFRELVALVKPENRVSVGHANPSAVGALSPSTLALLFRCKTKTLLIPADLDANVERATGKPTDEDFSAWLLAIDREISDQLAAEDADNQEFAARIVALLKAATVVLELCGQKGDAKSRIVRQHRNARILGALDVRDGRELAESLESLEASQANRRLFTQTTFKQTADVRDKFGHTKKLASALNDERVLIISSETAGFIQLDGCPEVPSAADAKAILEALGKPGQPVALSGVEARRSLLKSVHKDPVTGDARRGLRYLLHGSPNGFMADETTLWVDPGKGDSPWIKLWREIEPGSWFVLPESLASDVPPNDWEMLGISQVQETEVVRRLQRNVDLSIINGHGFSDAERETILAAVNDVALWRLLPLHIDTKGHIAGVDADTFLDNAANVPASLAEGCRFVRQARNQDHAQKQRQWLPHWSSETTILRALASKEPHRHWELILSAVTQVTTSSESSTLKQLRAIPWLPLATGGMISPDDVINIEELTDEIDYLSSQCGYPFAGVSGLHQDVRRHPAFASLRRLFSVHAEALSRLGQLMAEVPGHDIGPIGILDRSQLEDVAQVLSGITTLPAWTIIAKAISVFDSDSVVSHLLTEISRPLPLDLISSALTSIADSGGDPRHKLAFDLYLRQLAQAGSAGKNTLRTLRLRSQAGTWEGASSLCVGAAGVVGRCLLDTAQARILGGLIVDNSGPASAESTQEAVAASEGFLHADALGGALTEYFRPWGELMPSPPIGAFLCLLGLTVRSLGEKYLQPHSLTWLTERLDWQDPGQTTDGTWQWMSRMTALEALDKLDPRIRVSADTRVDVVGITGDAMSVELESSMETIFAGAFSWQGGFALNIQLRHIPHVADMSAETLSHLLKRSALHLLHNAYNQRNSSITPLWDELEKSDQLSLDIARDLILENLPFYLQQLKVAKQNEKLADALSDHKRLQGEKSEAANSNQTGVSSLERRVSEAKRNIARLMVEHPDVQQAVLAGVRDRVQQSQYELSSIAFELFQNADDAVAEMQALHLNAGLNPLPPKAVGRFVLDADGAILRFIHWGRPINYTGQGSTAKVAYRDDLENMLILSASDKDAGQHVTGKFGLGFKSVLLATDSPRILSADLRVKVVGGCLPERWTGPEVDRALDAIERHRSTEGPRLRATLIELHVGTSAQQAQVLERFEALAGIQAVFSNEIRRIAVKGQEIEWSPVALTDDCPRVGIGTIRVPTKSGFAQTRLMVWRGHKGAVALRLDSRGATLFESTAIRAIPSIWVTAPTRESPADGLILNARFELDAGRGALAHGEGAQRNQALALEIAQEFARDLKLVVQASRADWVACREKLMLAQDVSAAAFWGSFWKHACYASASADASQSAQLLHRFQGCLLERFVSLASEVPNGMPDDLASFVAVDKISLAVSERWLPALAALRKCSVLTDHYPVTGWIHKDVANALEAAKDEAEGSVYPRLSAELLTSCVPAQQCSPETATALSLVLTCIHPLDAWQINTSFNELTFMAADRSWQLGAELLKDLNAPEEKLCIAFAPDKYVLHGNYGSMARQFAVDHSPVWSGAEALIASWILGAPDPAKKNAALRYLLEGRLNFSVRLHLRAHIIGTWLESLQMDSNVLSSFSEDDRKQLIAMLNPAVIDFAMPSTEPDVSMLVREAALERIYEWWLDEGSAHLAHYDKNLWPASVPKRFADTENNRTSWMTLFALGLMQRLGRTRDFQHRGFIDFTDSKGWWQVFCEVRPQDDPEAWINILREYAEQPVADEKYIRWMDCFPSLYRIARWMDVYAHVFISLDQRTITEVSSYLTPNQDPVLDGSDIVAPSLRNSLRKGQHLIVRELLRAGELKSDTAKRLAYMASYGVKNLLTRIGYPIPSNGIDLSRLIIDGLGDRADFGGDYDIPLIVLAGDSALLWKVLDIPSADEDWQSGGTLFGMEFDDEPFA
ncbi:hypothetical protein [Aromatoleum aromaticum]|uniref:hypothetical protein n=1 Tax=Aromatoleum aromaticum TaxID=551760 RepID=UPI0012FEA4A7|nr:hypothetical protein [Aromatoleum aromaticum]